MVRDYLLHHGYADTLAAFDRSCACADEEAPKTSAPSPSTNGHRCWLLISLGTGILKGETDLRLVFHLATGIRASGVLQAGRGLAQKGRWRLPWLLHRLSMLQTQHVRLVPQL